MLQGPSRGLHRMHSLLPDHPATTFAVACWRQGTEECRVTLAPYRSTAAPAGECSPSGPDDANPHAAPMRRDWSRSSLPRPYIWRLTSFSLVGCRLGRSHSHAAWRRERRGLRRCRAICAIVLPDRCKAGNERLLASRDLTSGFRVEHRLRPLQIPPPNGLAGQPCCCTDLLRHRILEI